MKAILEFDLPQDQDLFTHCSKASQYHYALLSILQYIRMKRKNLDGKEYEIMDEVYELVCEITSEVGVD
jgi:hypothetical protein